jgi:thiosulfate sulfurtransferase
MKKFKVCTVSDMPALLATEQALLLDCRKILDYQVEHIDNALHSHDQLVETLIKKSDKNRVIVIYCYHGHSSEHLAQLFGGFGFNNVYSLEGGYERYKQAGF